MNHWTQAWRLTRRELRGGTKGFRIFLACLILGVCTIAGVNSLNQSISDGLARDGRVLLGGDVDLRLSSRTITNKQRLYFKDHSTLSHISELRAMAAHKQERRLVELKAVDTLYPLVGSLDLSPKQDLETALKNSGAIVEKGFLERLHIKIGDSLTIGKATLQVRAVIVREPDRIASVINFGPRVMISAATLKETGLVQPGSVVRHHYRLKLNDPHQSHKFSEDLKNTFPQAGWRVRTADKAAPGVENFIEKLTLFLSFVGFTTLLIGGVGVSAGVRDYLDGKIATIATLKSLGAPSAVIFRTYLLQILFVSFMGTMIGLIIGASTPFIAALLPSTFFPVRPEATLYPSALLSAAGFGILTVLSFSLWPLGRSQNIPASALFRDKITPSTIDPAPKFKYFSYIFILLLIILILITAYRIDFAVIFISASMLTLTVLKMMSKLTVHLARKAPHTKNSALRLAIAALHRPGTTAPSVILSLGLGLSVLVCVSLIDRNLRGQISEEIPKEAPAFFFIDIQNNQVAGFDRTLQSISGTKNYKRVPSLRARIVEIKGIDVEKVVIAPDSQWAIRGDRALTYASTPSEGSQIIKGQWWDADYSGKPLISLDAGLAHGFGVDLGDTLTLNVLGRNIKAEITSLRKINWKSMRFDFAIIMSPGLLEHAPHSHIGAIQADEAAQITIEKAVAQSFPNISIIRVKEALESVRILMDGISSAIAAAASLTVLAGALVLSGAMASGRERRTYEAIIFKVLGATRLRMVFAYLIEYGLLGALTGVISALIGTLASWGVVTYLMKMNWSFYPSTILITLLISLILTLGFGFLSTWRALGQKAANHLRNE